MLIGMPTRRNSQWLGEMKALLLSALAECTVFWGVGIMLKSPEHQGVPLQICVLCGGDSYSSMTF